MKDKFTGDRVKGEKVKSSRRACLISTKRGQYNKNDESRKEESNFPERCGIVGKRARKEKVYPITTIPLIFLREGQTRMNSAEKLPPRLGLIILWSFTITMGKIKMTFVLFGCSSLSSSSYKN